MTENTTLEITSDSSSLRFLIQEIINVLRSEPDGKTTSRERSLAVTKLQETRFWLGEDLFKSYDKEG